MTCLPVKVGARGSVLEGLCQEIGFRETTVFKKAADEALRSSFWIWILRARNNWKLSTGFKPSFVGESSTKDVAGGRNPVRNRQGPKQKISHVPKNPDKTGTRNSAIVVVRSKVYQNLIKMHNNL